MQQRYLIFVEGDTNHNKFYRMTQKDTSTWTAVWGRVGSSEQTMDYPMSQWDKKLKEKLKKGYTDITSLKGYAKQTIQQNYLVISENVYDL